MSIKSLYDAIEDSCITETTHPSLQNLTDLQDLGIYHHYKDSDTRQKFYRGKNARGQLVYYYKINGIRYRIPKGHLDYYWCAK